LFGEKLKQARNENNVSQKTLADIIGRRNDQISQLERGVRQPSKKEFENICNILNRTPEFFFPEGVPKLREDRPNKTYNKFGKPNKPTFGKRSSRFDTSKKLDKTYGQSKMSAEEIKKITDTVTVNGEIFDVEKEEPMIEPTMENETDNPQEAEQEVEEIIDESIESQIETGCKNKRLFISIPIGDKNIKIIIENI
jgi:transcriptional regulator with XRE-family HTH domain